VVGFLSIVCYNNFSGCLLVLKGVAGLCFSRVINFRLEAVITPSWEISVIVECAICGRQEDQLRECSKWDRQVCDMCFVEIVGLCTDCEETWTTEEDLDFQ
jgi:hypothetical protein